MRVASYAAVVALVVAPHGCAEKSSATNDDGSLGDARPADGGYATSLDAAPTAQDGSAIAGDAHGRDAQSPPENTLVLKHGWDIPSPQFVADNLRAMEQQGFDGVFITSPSGQEVQTETPLSSATLQAELEPLAALSPTTLRHNFYVVYATDGGDITGNYDQPRANFRSVATSARNAGFVGIAYDNEEYAGTVWDHPTVCSAPLATCRDAARRQGREIMAAMLEEWPTIQVLVLHGAIESDALTAQAFDGSFPYNDVSFANELQGSFVIGMTEACVGTDGVIIDGGQEYTLRTPGNFEVAYNWTKTGFAAQSDLVPGELRAAYADVVSVAFGHYDLPFRGADMNLVLWEQTLPMALSSADKYVWLYTERYDWWGTGWPTDPVPPAWIEATQRAVAAARTD